MIKIALSRWNLQQPAWSPFRTWSQLNLDQKVEVALISAELSEKRMLRDEELQDFANRVGDLVGIRLSTDQARRIAHETSALRGDRPERV